MVSTEKLTLNLSNIDNVLSIRFFTNNKRDCVEFLPESIKKDDDGHYYVEFTEYIKSRFEAGVLGYIMTFLDSDGEHRFEKIVYTNYYLRAGNNKVEEDGIDVDKSDFGLGNVDDTADMDKPVSKAQKAYIDEKFTSEQDRAVGEEKRIESELNAKFNSINIPTKVSQLTNDAEYVCEDALNKLVDAEQQRAEGKEALIASNIDDIKGVIADVKEELTQAIQDEMVRASNAEDSKIDKKDAVTMAVLNMKLAALENKLTKLIQG